MRRLVTVSSVACFQLCEVNVFANDTARNENRPSGCTVVSVWDSAIPTLLNDLGSLPSRSRCFAGFGCPVGGAVD